MISFKISFITLATAAFAGSMNDGAINSDFLAEASTYSEEILTGSTCLSDGSLCAYNFSCKSKCCSNTIKTCVAPSTNGPSYTANECTPNPVSFPQQPDCYASSSRSL